MQENMYINFRSEFQYIAKENIFYMQLQYKIDTLSNFHLNKAAGAKLYTNLVYILNNNHIILKYLYVTTQDILATITNVTLKITTIPRYKAIQFYKLWLQIQLMIEKIVDKVKSSSSPESIAIEHKKSRKSFQPVNKDD